MLSSLFPRSSIYKDLDDDRHNHGFDTDNTALFSADEHLEDDEAVASADHAAASAGMTGRPFGHRYQASLSDPFEKVPKTGIMLPQLPLIPSGSAGPSRATSPSERDRGRKQAVEDSQVAPRSSMDPFAGADVYPNDPMAALSQRLNNPFGSQQRPEAGLDGDHLHDEDQHREEEEPPKSIMFGQHHGGADTIYQEASGSRYQPQAGGRTMDGSNAASQSHLASSSHILGKKRQVPWWLRENRKRLNDLAETSVSQNLNLEQSASHGSQHAGDLNQPKHAASAASPETQTMFLPTHGRAFPLQQQTGSPSSNIRNFVQNVYYAGRDAVTLGASPAQGPIHLQTHLSKQDKALWNWINVDDLDAFLQEVYTFYVKKGIWSIALAGFLDLLTIGFVIGFSVFLLGCVDYSVIRHSHSLAEVVVPRCVSRFHGATLLLVLMVAIFYALRIIKFGQIVKRLFIMRDFFTELLKIPESDMQTVPWPVIVDKISILRAEHPAVAQHADFTDLDQGAEAVPKPPSSNKPRLDAHDVANRIMRKENYFIALFNKNVINTAVPIPPLLARSRSFAFLSDKLGLVTTVITPGDLTRTAPQRGAETASAALLTKVLEWNLTFCLLGFLFGPDGQVRRQFVSERNKKDLVQALRRRFILMGFINAIFAPFIILYLLFYSFFRYFEEYHKNPSSLGTRSYTQLARWKFREFNELPHVFQMRLHRSYPLAEAYVSQFPNDRMAQLARFVAFVSGSFASVLVLFSLIDPDAFLHFEVTKDRTVLFYIGIFGSLMAIARGMVPDDHRVVDPAALMREVIEETHYMPVHWHGNLHSADVHREFSLLFPLKIVSFFHELFSVLTTPLVLWFTLPRSANQIIDFFREFTIHVDGLGYVCSFAVFDFARTGLGDARYGAPVAGVVNPDKAQGRGEDGTPGAGEGSTMDSQTATEADVESQDGVRARPHLVIDERLVADQGKLEKSILGFKNENPNWQPQDQSTSMYLSRMNELSSNSMFLPPPSALRRDFERHRPTQQVPQPPRSGSRSSNHNNTRRSSRNVQPSPFTSPIFEHEDGMPSLGGVSIAGTSAVLDRGRRQGHGLQLHQRVPHRPQGQTQYQAHQHSNTRYKQDSAPRGATLPIAEEAVPHEHEAEEDVDPYIRPDDGAPGTGPREVAEEDRHGDGDGGPSPDITGFAVDNSRG